MSTTTFSPEDADRPIVPGKRLQPPGGKRLLGPGTFILDASRLHGGFFLTAAKRAGPGGLVCGPATSCRLVGVTVGYHRYFATARYSRRAALPIRTRLAWGLTANSKRGPAVGGRRSNRPPQSYIGTRRRICTPPVAHSFW